MPAGFRIDGITFTPDTLQQHAQYGAALGAIITSFSLVEGVVGGIYGMLRHEKIEAALEDLERLSTNSKRVEAVRKELAKNATFSIDPRNDRLMIRILKYAEARNKIAHGIWGYNESVPDILYRLPVKKWIDFIAAVVAAGTSGTATEKIDELKTHLEKYTLDDLKALHSEGAMLLAMTFELFNGLARAAAKSDGWQEE